MIIAAAVLTLAMQFEIDLGALFRAQQRPKVHCGIKVVGYRFVGPTGQVFRYAGDLYTIPEEGSIELIADPRSATYILDGRRMPLGNGSLDQFGFRTVDVAKDLIEKQKR